MVPFAQRLRDHMDADTSKKYYLSAAPQCPFPDVADNAMLDGAIAFDFISVQFYNNYCGIQNFVPGAAAEQQNNFNFATWDNWAKTASKNKDVKILLGVPANTGAGNGYQPATALASIIQYSKQFSSFGGVMVSIRSPPSCLPRSITEHTSTDSAIDVGYVPAVRKHRVPGRRQQRTRKHRAHRDDPTALVSQLGRGPYLDGDPHLQHDHQVLVCVDNSDGEPVVDDDDASTAVGTVGSSSIARGFILWLVKLKRMFLRD
jgi:hypothetical protein